MRNFLIAVAAVLLVGCTGMNQTPTDPSEAVQSDTTRTYQYAIHNITYNGHDYIVFSGGYGPYHSGQQSGVVHNPECRKCLKQVNQ